MEEFVHRIWMPPLPVKDILAIIYVEIFNTNVFVFIIYNIMFLISHDP